MDLRDDLTEGLSDEQLDVAYNVRRKAGEDFVPLMERYRSDSDAAVDGLAGTPGVVYDEDGGERLDVWGTEDGELRPVFIFFHGGFWFAGAKEDTAFMARMLHGRGVATVVPEYTLAPKVTVGEIVRQARAAVAWVWRHGREHGLDPDRIVVGGSSAGGHLTGMTMVEGWQDGLGLPADVVKAAMPFSGLFDLRPIVRTYVNEYARLDEETAVRLSPAFQPMGRRFPAVFAVGSEDGSGFVEQTRRFQPHWGDEGELLVASGLNHFDLVLELEDPDTEVSRALLGLFAALGREA
ncbi:alpha/beta hydrolase [Actinomadura harenae]|uniref:Alpha/beta hydrolase n=1 Tax=Actinomadura harenae TaxID=2483351 RepID=A0A3M2LZ34_9ACTN|nr:alpha/beta hydrolase [Actinomadura harenae]RMI42721.1 alpha/beta hydrolase [Actinomadura harenae]